MMESKQLGAAIVASRKKKGLSQRQLAAGICTQGAVSQLEKGTMLPRVDTLYYLALRLDLSLGYLVDVFLDPGHPERATFSDKLEHAAQERRHDVVLKEIDAFRAAHDVTASMGYYLDWFEAVSRVHQGLSTRREAISTLRAMLEKEEDIEMRRHHIHIRVMNSLANLYGSDNNTEQSLYYYDKILAQHSIPEAPAYEVNQAVFHIRVLYNKAKTLHDAGRWNEALETIEEGMTRAVEQENMSLIGQLYHYRGECLRALEAPMEEIRECYQRALLFFELLDKKQYSRLLWEHRSEYLT